MSAISKPKGSKQSKFVIPEPTNVPDTHTAQFWEFLIEFYQNYARRKLAELDLQISEFHCANSLPGVETTLKLETLKAVGKWFLVCKLHGVLSLVIVRMGVDLSQLKSAGGGEVSSTDRDDDNGIASVYNAMAFLDLHKPIRDPDRAITPFGNPSQAERHAFVFVWAALKNLSDSSLTEDPELSDIVAAMRKKCEAKGWLCLGDLLQNLSYPITFDKYEAYAAAMKPLLKEILKGYYEREYVKTSGRPKKRERMVLYYAAKVFRGEQERLGVNLSGVLSKFVERFFLKSPPPMSDILKTRLTYDYLTDIMDKLGPDPFLRYPVQVKPFTIEELEPLADLRPKELNAVIKSWRSGHFKVKDLLSTQD